MSSHLLCTSNHNRSFNDWTLKVPDDIGRERIVADRTWKQVFWGEGEIIVFNGRCQESENPIVKVCARPLLQLRRWYRSVYWSLMDQTVSSNEVL